MAKLNISKSRLFLYSQSSGLFPFVYFIVLSLIFVFAIKTGINKISSQRAQLKTLQRTENTLLEKENILKEAQTDILTHFRFSGIALPNENPSLVTLVQIKNLAAGFLLPLDEIKISGTGLGEGASNIGFSFKVLGDLEQIILFLKDTSTLSPITTIDKVELSGMDNITSADVKLKTFWLAYPEKLPSVTDPVKKITDNEIAVIEEMAKLIPPAFSNLSPTGPFERSTPFN